MTDNFERALQQRLLARSEVSSRDVEALRLFARTLPARQSAWRRPFAQLALAGAAIALAAAVALPALLHVPSVGTQSPVPTTEVPVTPAPTVPAPSSTPAVTPAPSPTTGRFELPVPGTPLDLTVDDPDRLVAAGGAAQQDAMTIRWSESTVQQIDSNTVRITWAAYPDEGPVVAQLTSGSDGVVRLTITQKAPPPLSDAQGADRIMVLRFVGGVDASLVKIAFQAR